MSEFEPNKKAKVDAADAAPAQPALAQATVKSMAGEVLDAREVDVSMTAAQLKELVAEETKRPASMFTLAIGENGMDDARTLAEQGIDAGAQIEITMLIDTHTLETDEAAVRAALSHLDRGNLVDGKSVQEWGFVEIADERIVKIHLSSMNLAGAQNSLLPEAPTSSLVAPVQHSTNVLRTVLRAGAIPSELGNCTALVNLNLQGNQLEGA